MTKQMLVDGLHCPITGIEVASKYAASKIKPVSNSSRKAYNRNYYKQTRKDRLVAAGKLKKKATC